MLQDSQHSVGLWDIDDDLPVEPYRYVPSNKKKEDLGGYALANSIKEFARALQRVGKYCSTGGFERVNTILLEQWATEVDLVFGWGLDSQELVGIMSRVSEAFEMFAEEVACDSAIGRVKNKLETKVADASSDPNRLPDVAEPMATDDGGGQFDCPCENEMVEPCPALELWADADRDVIADTLRGQQLKLFKLLWSKSRWTYYGDLKNARAEKLWRGQPDPADVEDGTVFEALRKLQKAMLPEWQYVVLIENESLRVKIERT